MPKKRSGRNDVPMRRPVAQHCLPTATLHNQQPKPPSEASEQKVPFVHSWKNCSARRSALLRPVAHQRVHPRRRDLPPPGKELGKLGNCSCRYAAVAQQSKKLEISSLLSNGFKASMLFLKTQASVIIGNLYPFCSIPPLR